MPDKIYVMWTPPQNQNIKIRNYILGWGKGVADVYFQYLDEKQRSFVIEHLGIFSNVKSSKLYVKVFVF